MKAKQTVWFFFWQFHVLLLFFSLLQIYLLTNIQKKSRFRLHLICIYCFIYVVRFNTFIWIKVVSKTILEMSAVVVFSCRKWTLQPDIISPFFYPNSHFISKTWSMKFLRVPNVWYIFCVQVRFFNHEDNPINWNDTIFPESSVKLCSKVIWREIGVRMGFVRKWKK